jgi:pimeloyl-ACP methyl ester carboxylesterase
MMKLIFLIGLVFSYLSQHLYANDNGTTTENETDKQTIVFVHGAWGGGWDYIELEKRLEAKGHHVSRVTLTGQGERSHLLNGSINLNTHIMDVINRVKYDGLKNITLVGHSYGGMVITGVADRIAEQIEHLVYVDAFLPLNGERALDFYPKQKQQVFLESAETKGNGISIPPFWPNWESSKDVPHPLGTYLQPISLTQKITPNYTAHYILTLDEGAKTDRFSPFAKRAIKRGWKYVEWVTGHNAQRSALNQYVSFLDQLSDSTR